MHALRTTLLTMIVTAAPVLATSPAEAAPPTCAGHPATIVGTPGADTIRGTRGADVIVARGGHDVVRGLGGHDIICGNAGDDVLHGGAGNDRLVAGAVNTADDTSWDDVLHGGTGNDVLVAAPAPHRTGRTRVMYTSVDRPVTVDLGRGTAFGHGRDRILGQVHLVGSNGDDTLIGSDRADIIEGAGGSDVIRGLGGVDWLSDGWNDGSDLPLPDGNDRIFGGSGRDSIQTYRGLDRVDGGGGPDLIGDEHPGPDVLRGSAGSDRIGDLLATRSGGLLDGGPGDDVVSLWWPWGRRLRVDTDLAAGTTVRRDTGASTRVLHVETVDADWRGRWNLRGTSGGETVRGSDGIRVRAVMGAGDDTVWAGSGRDYVNGQAGTDTAWLDTIRSDNTCISVEKGRC